MSGTRVEPFVDDSLIETMRGASLWLHSPIPREVVPVHDAPWNGRSDVTGLAGQPVRLRFVLSDADLDCRRFR